MSRRLQKTLIDYVVIAINPVLIMLLIGSFLYYLLAVFYQGSYDGRLRFILAMFIMAAVLIGRISIEEGKERAGLFAGPLAVVTYLALLRFVRFHGGLAGLSWLLNLVFIGLVWWAAHKLTWDCTVVDEEEKGEDDAGGEGLLDTAGLDQRRRARRGVDAEPEEPEGVTGAPLPERPWWERWVRREARPHAPGLGVVYFSLVALPIFAFGQLLVPGAELELRRYMFFLVVGYVASGLGLLMNTSFLGLRRYLRRRRVEMPPAVASMWLSAGTALIVALLAAAALVPRPNAEYAWADLSFHVGSPQRGSSRYGVGSDGADVDRGGPRTGSRPTQRPRAGPQATQVQRGQGAARGDEPGQRAGGPDRAAQEMSPSARSRSGQSRASGDRTSRSRSGGARTSAQGDSRQDSDEPRQTESSAAGRPDQGEKGRPAARPQRSTDQARSAASRSAERLQRTQQSPEQRAETGKDRRAGGREPRAGRAQGRGEPQRAEEAPRRGGSNWFGDRQQQDDSPGERPLAGSGPGSSFRPFSLLARIGGMLFGLVKWAIFLALVAVGLYWMWRHWPEMVAFLRQLAETWRALLARLFGRRPAPPQEASAGEKPQGPPPRPFSDFVDPFLSGAAETWPPDEVVKYTFEAIEAWARQQECPRGLEETPHEFARKLGKHRKELGEHARQLARLYCHVAYAPDTLRRESIQPLRELWSRLEQASPAPA
ncbi:MAG TPA: DUF4129 domain-containing protein [Planctomycetaceae bacterium]|nr:DUF4129 domain-containing protein [Planctomycetaceae bacterium]HIQ19676.1 DUF4129 domain-containing protein [Planctomycetota bacterium]